MTRILIAEDEEGVASFLAKGLEADGYAATVAADGRTALRLASTQNFDLMILDLGLPRMDGLDVLRHLRAAGRRLPVLILSARDDVVPGLDLGADDYLRKPFRFEELLARLRTRLRAEGTAAPETLTGDGLELDLRSRRLTVEGHEVELSAREFKLLAVFLRHRGQVLSQEQLLSLVWGYDFDPGSNVVEVYVSYLRRKVGRQRIQTVRGMGYALQA